MHRFFQGYSMSKVCDIQSAIKSLSKEDKVALREWFDQLDAEDWDRQFEEDAKSGKLDTLADKAISDFRSGKSREL